MHHAIRDTLEALSRQQAAIASLRAQLSNLVELSARVDALEAEFRNESEARRADHQNQRSEISTMRAELQGESEARRIQIEDSEKQLQTLLATRTRKQVALFSELSDRDDQIENEQRVSFKQLSLESSEAAAFQTTSRRKLESTLAELDQRIKQLEESLKRTR